MNFKHIKVVHFFIAFVFLCLLAYSTVYGAVAPGQKTLKSVQSKAPEKGSAKPSLRVIK